MVKVTFNIGVQGVHLKEAQIDLAGFVHDREFLLLQKESKNKNKPSWISINQSPKMGLTTCRFEEKDRVKYLVFSHPDQQEDLWITTKMTDNEEITYINFEGDALKAYHQGEEAQKWFSEAIGREVVLVRSSEKPKSPTNNYEFHYQLKGSDIRRSGHTQGCIHVVNQKSVDELNEKIQDPDTHIDGDVFRPNIILDGITPGEEDDIREMELVSSDTNFRVIKHCIRCKMPNYNKEKGMHNKNGEPLATLRKYKTHPEVGTIFGIFIQPDQECSIRGKSTLLIDS